jgi:DNA-binding transcriptional ArsR family regulator
MNTALATLADPIRRQALEKLRHGECTAGDIERDLGVSQPSASKHLRALREAGLVKVRVDANRRLYRLDPRPLAELDAWLAPYRQFWTEKLDALERHLDQES